MSIAHVSQGFHDVGLLANNVAELRRFYAALGFQQVVDLGDDLAVFLVGGNELAIHTAATRPQAALVLSIVVTDLDLVQRELAQRGIAFQGPRPARPGMLGIAIFDPNGNKLEFLKRG